MANKKKTMSLANHEQRKARMRAYYHKNKNKWRKYKRDALTRMTNAERDARREKRRAYHRAYYKKNREKIIARTVRYQHEHLEWFVAYRAEWHQTNKKRVAERRRRHYHKVVKHRNQVAKGRSPFVSVSEAVLLLGAKLRPFREWVYQGRIAAVRTPGGRYHIHRDEVERIRTTCHHLPPEIRNRLGLNSKEGANE